MFHKISSSIYQRGQGIIEIKSKLRNKQLRLCPQHSTAAARGGDVVTDTRSRTKPQAKAVSRRC